MRIKVILFDFVGTIVKEKDPTIMARCLSNAFIEHGIFLNCEFFNSQKGENTLDIIRNVLHQHKAPLSMVADIYDLFKKNLKNNIENFVAVEDGLRVFSHLLRIGFLIGVKTKLPKEVFDDIYLHQGWTKRGLSYIGFLGEMNKSRSTCNMILDMMTRLNIENLGEILKVSASAENIMEEKKIGCKTTVLLSNIQPIKEVIKGKPDFILNSLFDVVNLVLRQNVKLNDGGNSLHSLMQL